MKVHILASPPMSSSKVISAIWRRRRRRRRRRIYSYSMILQRDPGRLSYLLSG